MKIKIQEIAFRYFTKTASYSEHYLKNKVFKHNWNNFNSVSNI